MAEPSRLPPPPREPDLDECCGNGCEPCVFDLYEARLARWRARCEALQAAADKPARGARGTAGRSGDGA